MESLRLQNEQVELAREQFAKADRLHEGATAVQARGEKLVGTAQKIIPVIILIIIGLIAYLSWILFRF